MFDEHFGCSDAEVKDMLSYYGLEEKYGTVKEWYDGYCFGNADVYCPWDWSIMQTRLVLTRMHIPKLPG